MVITLLEGVVRHYNWGSPTFIPEMLGLSTSGEPWAELWLGAHPTAPSTVVMASSTVSREQPKRLVGEQAESLDRLIAANPVSSLGSAIASQFGELPFLLKVLAAARPLSLQVHPSADQARVGFEREQALNIPVDAPHRSFRDPSHKPELVCALSRFEALCGLRDVEATLILLDTIDTAALNPVRERLRANPSPDGLRDLIGWLLSLDKAYATKLVDLVVQTYSSTQHHVLQTHSGADSVSNFQAMIATLGEQYPGDAGVIVAMLLNYVTLAPGEALFLAAGNLHCYLRGAAVEVMACSDNVLRGGLTSKHIDVDTLLNVIDPTPTPVKVQRPELIDGIAVYQAPVSEFLLRRVEVKPYGLVTIEGGPAVLLCAEGFAHVNGTVLAKGQAVWADVAESSITLTGNATVFCASVRGIS